MALLIIRAKNQNECTGDGSFTPETWTMYNKIVESIHALNRDLTEFLEKVVRA